MNDIPRFTHHVYLVSEQAAPNITPALDPTVSPDQVTLVVSPGMQQRAQWLSRVLREGAGVKVEFWKVGDAWDIEYLLESFMLLLEQAQPPPALNATGGTKPMSIAAFEAFRAYERPVFYIHPHTDDLFWLYPHKHPRHQLEDKIKLRHFLLAYGAEIKSEGTLGVPPAYQQLAEHLIQEIEKYDRAIATLNWYAAAAGSTLESPVLQPDHLQWEAFRDMLANFEQAGVLRIANSRLVFPDEIARTFVNGGWLEQHVYVQVQKLRKRQPLIQDVKQGLQVVRNTPRGNVENELDVVFLANNRLFLVECKTRRFHPDKGMGGPGTEAIYKLDTLKELLGGLHGQGMLISYLPMREADLTRAHDLGIRICQGKQLQNLAHLLDHWIASQQMRG